MDEEPLASAVTLIGAPDAALWLKSRAGLPTYVEVTAARTNPLFGFCPSVTVELWTVGLISGSAPPRRLDSKTFALSDPWDLRELLSPWGTTLDCINTTTLALGGWTGPVVFVMKDGESGVEIGRSPQTPLSSLPVGAADDEQPGWLDPALDAAEEVAEGALDVIQLATIGAVVVGLVVFAPTIKTLVEGFTHGR
jgi:hypothetical protein